MAKNIVKISQNISHHATSAFRDAMSYNLNIRLKCKHVVFKTIVCI